MKKAGFIKNNYHYIIFSCYLLFVFFVSISGKLYLTDDVCYFVASKSQLSEIFEFMKWHYFNQNGRYLVHLMDVFALRYNGIPWMLSNILVMGTIIIFLSKIFQNEKFDFKKSLIFFTILFCIMDFEIVRAAVYWISASFNYFYPASLFIIIVYMIKEEKYNFLLIAVSFILSVTMEMYSMIEIGFFVLIIIINIFLKKSINKHLIISLVASVIGFSTNLFAPGTFNRIKIRDESVAKDSIFNVIYNKCIFNDWFNVKSIIFMSLFTISISILLIKLYKTSHGRCRILFLLEAFGLFVFMIMNWVCEAISFKECTIYYIIILSYVFLFVVSLISSGIFSIIYLNSFIPIIAVILGLGAQLMVCFTLIVTTRTMFPSIICFLLYIGYSVSVSYDLLKSGIKIISMIAIVLVLIPHSVYLYSFFRYPDNAMFKDSTQVEYYYEFPDSFKTSEQQLDFICDNYWPEIYDIVAQWIEH